MSNQFFEVDDPWVGPVIELDENAFLTSQGNWFAEYHGKLYFDVVKNGGIDISLMVYFLDIEENTISYQEFYMTNEVPTTVEVQFPSESHVISTVLLRNLSEGSFTFTISDIRNDNVHAPGIFWTGLKGLTEIAE